MILLALLLGLLFYFLLVLLSVAYLTLYERHLLGLRQLRRGPGKATFRGVLQPLLDALKLLQKCTLRPSGADTLYYHLMPLLGFGLLFFQMLLIPALSCFLGFAYGGLLLLCLVGVLVYTTFFLGYYSSSKYAYVGALRAGVQRISYEVVLFFLFFSVLRLSGSFGLVPGFSLILLFLFFILFLVCLAELGRAPFDFTEGERELVRGYNLEYRGVLFVFIFLSEYGFMLFFSGLLSRLCFGWAGGPSLSPFLVLTLFLLCRRALPRYRYDLLMLFFWRVLLPVSMQIFLLRYLITVSPSRLPSGLLF